MTGGRPLRRDGTFQYRRYERHNRELKSKGKVWIMGVSLLSSGQPSPTWADYLQAPPPPQRPPDIIW